MVVGTYRDSDLSRDHPLTALLADLHRDRVGERIKLAGLESEDVLALMEALAGQALGEDGAELAREITRETAGNPFFAVELSRQLVESGVIVQDDLGRWQVVGEVAELQLPRSVREVIGRRVERLDSDAHTALSAAATIGRDFDFDLLLAVLDLPEERLLDLLEQAVSASLLQESSERAGSFTFTHALVRHTLYDDLGATRRTRLHRRVAEALEEQCGDDPGDRLGELARHWAAAVVSADTAGKAVHYARRAGDRALEQLAPDEAAQWYRQALVLYEEATDGERSERCALLIGLGEAQRQTGAPGFAGRCSTPRRLHRSSTTRTGLRAPCSPTVKAGPPPPSSGRSTLIGCRRWRQQPGPLQPTIPGARRCSRCSHMAYHGGSSERCRALATEAIEIARAARDPGVLAHTLANATAATWATDTLPERQRVSHELAELVGGLDDPRLSFWAALRRAVVGLQVGTAEVESGLETMRAVATSVPEPLMAWTRLKLESCWALVRGDLRASERWAIEARAAGDAVGEPDAGSSFSGQVSRVRSFQGRGDEIAEHSLQHAREPDSVAMWRAAAAMGLIESDRPDEARELMLAADFQGARSDETWLMSMLLCAEVCSQLRLRDRAGELYELLEPVSGEFVAGGTIVSGSVDSALGRLAAALDQYEQAEAHFAAAARIEERLGAPLFLARTRVAWAHTLIARGRPQDLQRVEPMLDQAERTARRLGATGVTREVTACRTSLPAITG